MTQLSIHFPGHKEPDQVRKILKVRVPEADETMSAWLTAFSSYEVKQILGAESYAELKRAAKDSFMSINSYAVSKLAEKYKNRSPEQAQLFPGKMGTYRGGKGDFFHDLFPYIEAFSPDFVTGIMDRFAPGASRILDPFGGCGTSPLTFTSVDDQVDKEAYYCEINPVMQKVVWLKSQLRSLSLSKRKQLSKDIKDYIVTGFLSDLECATEDDLLSVSYSSVFKGSDIFPRSTLSQVLKTKTLIRKLRSDLPYLGYCLEIAALSKIVVCSNMQRAGDLRKKRPEERERISADFYFHLLEALSEISVGLTTFETSLNSPVLIAEDVRHLSEVPPMKVDAVITSPPYLNGTNYIRNTKIELWFMDALKNPEDLGRLRDRAITAGINDVRGDRSKSLPPSTPFSALEKCLSELDEKAYDRRIPKMIRWYAHDMFVALEAVILQLKVGGVIAIDIGDSVYSGIRVPVDELLVEIIQMCGCSVEETVLIRERMSRGGLKVKQVCIVAKKRENAEEYSRSDEPYFESSWGIFKDNLPHKQPPFNKRNWGHQNHSICSYQGKLKPSIAKFLVDSFVPEEGTVLDPFSGVGTIPFEAALRGRQSFGFDLSPSAVAISRAKISRLNVTRCYELLSDLANFIEASPRAGLEQVWLPSFNRSLKEYYHPNTFLEILASRGWFLAKHPWDNEESLLLACMLHILHGNRPYALSRRSHPVTPFAPSGDYEEKKVVDKLKAKVERVLSQELPTSFMPGSVYEMDATDTWPQDVDELDAVITSPPFFDSTRFFMSNWIRLWFSGWDEFDFVKGRNSFLEERQKISLSCYDSIFRQSRERLKSGSPILLHLGKSKKCDMGYELSKRLRYWFSKTELFNESVSGGEKHGLTAKGTVTDHQYLLAY